MSDAPRFERFVREYQDMVFATAVRLLGRPADAEDVAQQVYFQVFREIHRFHGQSLFATWLYRVTVNEAMQHLRRKRRRRWSVLTWEPEERKPDCHVQSEERELLDQALHNSRPSIARPHKVLIAKQLVAQETGQSVRATERRSFLCRRPRRGLLRHRAFRTPRPRSPCRMWISSPSLRRPRSNRNQNPSSDSARQNAG